MAIVVSDTSPIRALNHLSLLHVLGSLYGEVLVPDAVCLELKQRRRKFGPLDIAPYPFLIPATAHDRNRVLELMNTLDPGESEAIVLALERSADAILMDEADGRKIAKTLGIKSTGVLGVLIDCKAKGLIGAVRPHLVKLQTELDFFLSAELIAEILTRAGE